MTIKKKKETAKKVVKKPVQKRVGRPKVTVEEILAKKTWDLRQIQEITMYGLTDKQLATMLDVNEMTINRWKKDEQFMLALKRGKLVADNEMIKSLYKSGLGYEYEEIKREGADIGSIEQISKVTKTTRYFPPNPTSCIFWLKNRLGWVDRQDFNFPEDVEITIKLID